MTAAAIDDINAMAEGELYLELRHCCASQRWVALVIAVRPFASAEVLLQHAAAALDDLGDEDWLEAFEVAGVRELRTGDEATRSATRVALRLYEERFGYPFVVADQLHAEELLMRVRIRLGLEPDAQQRASRAHQRRLTLVRLQRLIDRAASAERRAQSPDS